MQTDILRLLNVVSRMKKNYTTESDKGHAIEALARSVLTANNSILSCFKTSICHYEN
jgi:hypothetical protein